MTCTEDQFRGTILALAAGDAHGAPFEGGIIERALWRVIGTTRAGDRRWTDDTQMAIDLGESLIACGGFVADDAARRLARGYRWSRGYGPGAAKVLRRIRRGTPWQAANRSVFSDGSLGNGAAVRVPVVSLFFSNRDAELESAARASAALTHAHPFGIEGAVLVAVAVAAALRRMDGAAILELATASCSEDVFRERLAVASSWLRESRPAEPKEVVERLGHRMPATESCVTAVYVGARFLNRSFEELLAFARACGGDVDSIGAMAGAAWGAANGAEQLSDRSVRGIEQRFRLEEIAQALLVAGRRQGPISEK